MTDYKTLIEEQQKGQENTPAWMIGEQLKEICQREPESARLVEQNLIGALTLAGCADKLKAKADELHKAQKGNCVCITPEVAEAVIREYFGLASRGVCRKETAADSSIIDLADFL